MRTGHHRRLPGSREKKPKIEIFKRLRVRFKGKQAARMIAMPAAFG